MSRIKFKIIRYTKIQKSIMWMRNNNQYMQHWDDPGFEWIISDFKQST